MCWQNSLKANYRDSIGTQDKYINNIQQESHCTYYIILRRVRVTIIAVEKQ